MINLLIDADISAGTDLLGKSANDLQADIFIGDSSISGTLKYVTGYTGFSSVAEEQSGNYLALHCKTNVAADSITVEVIGDTNNHPVTLDSAGVAVIRITDKNTQKIKIVAYKDGNSVTKTYNLSNLTLNQS